MSSNIIIAIIVASIIAVAYFIAVIIFIIWKCKGKDNKHEKKFIRPNFSAQPTMLKRHPPTQEQLMLNQKAQLHYNRTPLVYTLSMPKQVNPNQAPTNKQQNHIKMWPTQNSTPTAIDTAFVWWPVKDESGPGSYGNSLKNKVEEDQSSNEDRQRKPHMGSIRHLPSHDGKTCKC